MEMGRKKILVKWAIRLCIFVLLFFATVIISRWVIALSTQQRENTAQIEQNEERIDTNENAIEGQGEHLGGLDNKVNDNHEQRIDGLEERKPGAPPARRSRHRAHAQPRAWWQKLFNP